LAWAELYLCYGHVFRKFDIELDPSSPKNLVWRDCFLPEYFGPHLRARLTPVQAWWMSAYRSSRWYLGSYWYQQIRGRRGPLTLDIIRHFFYHELLLFLVEPANWLVGLHPRNLKVGQELICIKHEFSWKEVSFLYLCQPMAVLTKHFPSVSYYTDSLRR